MNKKRKIFPPKSYELQFSPLYQLSSKRKLADVLKVDLDALKEILRGSAEHQYRIFKDPETQRLITEPVGIRKQIHKRLMVLLNRITLPGYLHSAVKGKSYKTNAEAHCVNSHSFKIDIHKFYPSVKFDRIFLFFREALRCAIDIATILAKLCTVRTKKWGVHLPTGSCLSPVLSFLVNQNLFDDIHRLCESEGCVLTVYVDDVTVSGPKAGNALLMMVAMKIHQAGYKYHKIKTFNGTPALVTGLIAHGGKVHLPYKRCRFIRELTRTLRISRDSNMRKKILSSLVGRLAEAEYINPRYKSLRLLVTRKYKPEWTDIVAQRAEKSRLARRAKIKPKMHLADLELAAA
ncbi:hypothetical protein J2S30_000864 [Herbaspirillum rubrisubalbicans]|uniref:reverse transcriptase family protein n=1 Tax=Herbaspirillum rubrisubalbicans TaxID=80842 RepID=UPI00209CD56D|nr:reverse transcriptase family protein [Herbaspirillum rubrisubalbicans]MCP1572485.1 hypothetical protein [Herbaspirillum rubrisubalbicans]